MSEKSEKSIHTLKQAIEAVTGKQHDRRGGHRHPEGRDPT